MFIFLWWTFISSCLLNVLCDELSHYDIRPSFGVRVAWETCSKPPTLPLHWPPRAPVLIYIPSFTWTDTEKTKDAVSFCLFRNLKVCVCRASTTITRNMKECLSYSMPFIVGELWTIFERDCKSTGNSSTSLEQRTFVLYLLTWQNKKRTTGFERWAEFKSKVVSVLQNLRTDLKYWTDFHLNSHFTNCDIDFSFRNIVLFIPLTQFKVLL